MGTFLTKGADSEGGAAETLRTFIKSKWFLFVLLASALFVMGMWLNNELLYFSWWPGGPYILDLIVTLIQLPAYILASMVSAWLYGGKNPDAPNRIAYYILMFFTCIPIFSGLVGLFWYASKQVHKSRIIEKRK